MVERSYNHIEVETPFFKSPKCSPDCVTARIHLLTLRNLNSDCTVSRCRNSKLCEPTVYKHVWLDSSIIVPKKFSLGTNMR